MTIGTLLNKFQSIDTNAIIDESFIATEPDFELSQQAQLKAGKTSTGDPISPAYLSDAYAAKKNAMNPLPGYGVPDLFLTGSFSEQINVKLEGETVLEFSNDEKAPQLEEKYANIFGLGSSYKKDYLSVLRPVVNENISNFVGLSFE
jgi:hypothetical protein